MFNKFSIGFLVIILLCTCNNSVNIKHNPKVETLIYKSADTLKTERDTCICSKKNQSTFNISCDTIKLKNGAVLYSLFNSDSSWFEYRNSKKNIKRIFYSLPEELIEYKDRLGYSFIKEYKNYFLIENSTSSGSNPYCETLLFDSKNGKLIRNFYSKLYLSDKYPIIIKLANVNDTNFNDYQFSKIEVINFETHKSYLYKYTI